jgi:transcriptional antiterminator NusG
MQYYTIQVMTGSEDDFVRRLSSVLGKERLIVPKKLMPIRRRGKQLKELVPLFPGYLFLQSENILDELDLFWTIRRTDGFIRFLRESASPSPLSEKDLALIRQFISFGKYADTSMVTFDENDRIVVLEGPLKGLEGRITKVNRRKGRAKVVFDFYETKYPVDFGFEVVERVKGGGGTGNEEPRS